MRAHKMALYSELIDWSGHFCVDWKYVVDTLKISIEECAPCRRFIVFISNIFDGEFNLVWHIKFV